MQVPRRAWALLVAAVAPVLLPTAAAADPAPGTQTLTVKVRDQGVKGVDRPRSGLPRTGPGEQVALVLIGGGLLVAGTRIPRVHYSR